MQHFFVTPDQVKGDLIFVEGSDVNHMKNVLRMRIDEEVTISDGNNRQYLCKIKEYDNEEAILHIVEEMNTDTELPSRIYLFQGLPKQDKMELIVQKCVELGVYQVIPVATKRCVVKLDDKKAKKKIERWQQIAESGAKQSGRGIIPEVKPVMNFKDALDYAKSLEGVLIPYEKAEGMNKTREIIKGLKGKKSVGIFIGPEGGFDEQEIEAAMNSGVEPVTLGRRILRTETAGLTMLSILMFEFEEE